jgi:hypothetical protein
MKNKKMTMSTQTKSNKKSKKIFSIAIKSIFP